jgi:hypothetical protein
MKPEDKKLLEYAAKACGIELIRLDYEFGPYIKGTMIVWNPLTNNDDSFILAVQLDLMCSHKRFIKQKIAIVDPFYATRLAIVMAASEIGEKN